MGECGLVLEPGILHRCSTKKLFERVAIDRFNAKFYGERKLT